MAKQKRISNIFRTGMVNMLFQFIFLMIVFLLGSKIALNGDPGLRFIVLATIVLIPSIIWTIFFYLQDKLEPEPVPYLIVSFIAGMAAASLGVIPLYQIIFRIYDWLYASSLLFILGSFFVEASIVSLLIYIIIRYGFYPLKEFDEPVDGMVYGAIAGAGLAFVKSLHYLWLHPSYTIFVIAYTATANILIYSGVGSIIGYIIGRAKFQRKNVDVFSLIAISVGIILLGIYHLVNEFIFISGFNYAFWLSFALTLVYSFLILIFCYLRMQRLTRVDYHEEIRVAHKLDPVTITFIVILLIVGSFIAGHGLRGKKFVNEEYGISFYYPYSLSPFALSEMSRPLFIFNKESEIIFFGENRSPSHFSIMVKVYREKLTETTHDLIKFVEVSNTEGLIIKDITIGDKKGKRLVYSYLEEKPTIEDEFPQLIEVYTDVIPCNTITFIFTYKALSEHFKHGLTQYTQVLESLIWLENAGG